MHYIRKYFTLMMIHNNNNYIIELSSSLLFDVTDSLTIEESAEQFEMDM